jgi:hypothetical protein
MAAGAKEFFTIFVHSLGAPTVGTLIPEWFLIHTATSTAILRAEESAGREWFIS